MTTLHCDAHRIIDDGPVDGVIRISSSHVQYSQGDLVIPDFTDKEMIAGEATFTNVKPGRALVQIHWGFNSMVSIRVSIPDTDEITLSKLALQDYDLEPNIVSEVTKQAAIAEEALADTQQALKDTTTQANLATQARNRAVASAEAANTSKQTTNSYVKTVETHIETVLEYLGDTEAARDAAKGYSESASAEATRAAEKAQAAAQSETNSANSADAATQAANDSAESSQTASGAAETASASLSEVQSIEDSLKALMADTESWNDVQYALEQVDSDIASAMESVKQEILGGVGPAYDTLQELAEAFQGNQSAITALTDQIAGKAPKDHTHVSADITDTTIYIDGRAPNKIVQTQADGMLHAQEDPTSDSHLTRKGYVDQEVAKKAGKGHKHTIQDTNGLQTALDGKADADTAATEGYVDDEVWPMSGAGASIIPSLPGSDGIQKWASRLPTGGTESTPIGRYYSSEGSHNSEEAFFQVDPGVDYYASMWVNADKAGSVMYIELRDQDGDHAVESGSLDGSGVYLLTAYEMPTSWTRLETTKLRFTEKARYVKVASIYWNHGKGDVQDATQYLTDIQLMPIPKHTHEISEVNGLQEKLENINPDVGISDVAGLQPALQAKVEGMGIRFIQVVTRVPNPPNSETLYIVM